MKKWCMAALTAALVLSLMIAMAGCAQDKDKAGDTAIDASKYALINLHIHLDGALTPEDVIEMADMSDVDLPTDDVEELKTLLQCPDNCQDLNDYLECFDIPVAVMQTEETVSYAVCELVKRLDEQGIVYAEIRYAPQLHLTKGLTQEQVVNASIRGLNQGMEQSDIKAQLILCCMRGDDNMDENYETVRLAKEYLNKGVAACDLAGAEALYPTSGYQALFSYAEELGVPFTIHAGEADGCQSIQDAISYGAARIGHGVRAYNDDATKENIVNHNVTLELCPTSNLDTKAVEAINDYASYPIQDFLRSGVKVTINTDDDTVSKTTLKNEFERLFEYGVITEEDAKQIVHNSVGAAFLTESERAELLEKCDGIMNE